VDQISFGKDGTSRGYKREAAFVFIGYFTEFLYILQIQPFCLLIEEIACPCST
jgi:hypothetical protein